MVFANKSALTSAYVGNKVGLVELAIQDDRLSARSVELVGSTAIDNDAYLGSEGVEAVVNQYSMQANFELVYGQRTKALRPYQDRVDNVISVIFTDVMTHYTGPCAWVGHHICEDN